MAGIAAPPRRHSRPRPRRARAAATTPGGWPRQPAAALPLWFSNRREIKNRIEVAPTKKPRSTGREARRGRRRSHLITEDVVGRPSAPHPPPLSCCCSGRGSASASILFSIRPVSWRSRWRFLGEAGDSWRRRLDGGTVVSCRLAPLLLQDTRREGFLARWEERRRGIL